LHLFVLFTTLLITNLSISSVEFTGNETVSARALRSEIISEKGEEYSELNLNYDVERIKRLYVSRGYFSTEVTPEIRTRDTLVTVVFQITEGIRPRISEIVVSGAEPERLRGHFRVQIGDYFLREKLLETESKIEEYYKDRGFPFAEVSSRVFPDSGVLQFLVDQGGIYYVRNIEVRGLSKTRPNVVYREIELKPGDIYNNSKIYNSQRRIYALGFFSMLKVEMLRQQPDSLDLIFNVRELKSRILNFGIGITLPFSFLLSFGLEELNLANIGHRANINPLFKINIEREWEARVEARYTLPYVTPLGLKFSVLPFAWFEEKNDFSRHTRGNEFRITKVFSEEVGLHISHQYKYVRIEPKVILPDTIKGVTNSVKLQFLMDRRDEFFNPGKGVYLLPVMEYAGGILGGENDFVRLETEERIFFTVFNNTFAQRFKVGVLIPTNGVSIYEKYYLGGQYTLRGYPERAVGPDSLGDERYGNILLNLNLEYRIRLPLNFGLVGFFDAGYIDNEIILSDSDYLKMTAGFGLRYFTPIGPLRADIGFPLREKGNELYLGIYHTF
jgi:outer membrane protein insertion porin family